MDKPQTEHSAQTMDSGRVPFFRGIQFKYAVTYLLLIALVLFAVVDYLTGIMCAVADKKLSSHVGFKGICRKVLIFLLVGIANIIDVQVIGTGSVIRTAVIFFYLSNEGVSILENAAHLGLPIPEALKAALAQIHDRASDTDGKDGDE